MKANSKGKVPGPRDDEKINELLQNLSEQSIEYSDKDPDVSVSSVSIMDESMDES